MKNSKVRRMVGIAILAAVVVVLQSVGSFIRFGTVSISLVLIPIVVGAAMYGPGAGAVLGGVFSIVVLLQPDTSFFYGISFLGTVVTVLAKGILAGWLSGLTFRALAGRNEWYAVGLTAMVCPVVNTGIFLLGCLTFFMDALRGWAEAAGLGGNLAHYMIFSLVGVNFLVEMLSNMILSPAIVRLLRYKKAQ